MTSQVQRYASAAVKVAKAEDAETIAALRLDRAAALEMLKRYEDYLFRFDNLCFVCHRRAHEGHAPDCELAALIKRLENQ